MRFDIEKLKKVAKPASPKDIETAESRKVNSDWISMSQEIALSIHCYLRDKKMTKTALAEAMNVSPSYIGKLLKGNENLTLETICKLERIIGRKLIYTSRPRRSYTSGQTQKFGHYLSEDENQPYGNTMEE